MPESTDTKKFANSVSSAFSNMGRGPRVERGLASNMPNRNTLEVSRRCGDRGGCGDLTDRMIQRHGRLVED